ncbi:MAG: hypothetical protein ACYS0E_09760 [Planctomycetota bacterium]|jgi:hypothetical protein
MRSGGALLLLAACLLAQGGRDTGVGAPLVLFVRSARTTESKEIYDAAWKALEPHFGRLARERLYAFDGEVKRARAFFAKHPKFRTVVCFDRESRAWCPDPGKALLVESRTDRREVGRIIRLLRPLARKVFILGKPDEKLPGFRIVGKREEADVAWVTEDFKGEVGKLEVPLVSTSSHIEGAVTVRPDPRGVGLQLAAQILLGSKQRRPVSRHRVVVDVDAAGVRVPLGLLARADIVRRNR